MTDNAARKGRRIAVVDPASFVLPFDYYFVSAVADEGIAVELYCSRTTANIEFVEKLKLAGRIDVHEYDVSSTVAGRLAGVFNYLRMCLDIAGRARRYDAVILQFSIFPFLELLLFCVLRGKLWLQIHEETGEADRGHTPLLLQVLKKAGRRLLFVSSAVMSRHLASHPDARQKASLTRHGVLPVFPEELRIPIKPHGRPENVLAFWGLVKPYKGVDLFGQLADSGLFTEFSLEIHGKWVPSTLQTKAALMHKGVLVNDAFLTPANLRRLLLRPVVFVMPYRSASQSAVLYTLLNYGCVFVSTDVGDNGQFLREQALEELLFDRNDVRSVHRAARFAYEHFGELQERLLEVRLKFEWSDCARTVAQCLESEVDAMNS